MHRLLIVDDEPMNLEILREYLVDAQFEVAEAADGDEALGALEGDARGFDAVVLDRMMPRLDGMEVLRRMRRDDRWREVPVILQTAAATKEQVAEGLREGAYYYLPKPYEKEVLLAVVRSALGQRALLAHLHRRIERGDATIPLMREARLVLHRPSEARAVASLVSLACPDPALVLLGLMELCGNAIAYGLLGLGREEKARLAARGALDAELERRAGLARHAGRCVELEFRRAPGEIVFRVRDPGPGFDAPRVLARAETGGIQFCRDLAFDRLDYEEGGRCAVAAVLLPPAVK